LIGLSYHLLANKVMDECPKYRENRVVQKRYTESCKDDYNRKQGRTLENWVFSPRAAPRRPHCRFRVLPASLVAAQQAPSKQSSFISEYQSRVTATQSEQLHCATPLAAVIPRLEQEIRADFLPQTKTKPYKTWNFGESRGLKLIPERLLERT
jgi:hypothetical protein